MEKQANPWLLGTIGGTVLTLLVAVITWIWPHQGLDNSQLWQIVSSKVIVLSVLFSGTFWCGRMYKALIHQASVNRHRALSLQTFQAFSAAASDEGTKNAVLLETTRSIFAHTVTGLVNQDVGDEGKVVEIVKSVISKEK